MIYQLARDLADGLHARKFPVAVYYGSNLVSDGGSYSLLIQIDRDSKRGDSVGAAKGVKRNPDRKLTRMCGVEVLFAVSSTKSGPMQQDHEFDCEQLVDGFLTELFVWGELSGSPVTLPSEARYLSPDELAAMGLKSAVAYVLRFQVPRGVSIRDYEGSALTEVSTYGASTTVLVSRDGDEYEEVP